MMTLSSPERATGTWSRPLTPKGGPLSTSLNPQTLKWSRVITSVQVWFLGTELTDQNGKH
ncbi:rCG61542 [Rattus norvegicus]|uniref:RCG61542 n=1 Tax=Rattus norvegicus TaxID=10116 RepID=A6HAK8_RAT|nr:rCG61542 [Rattus norvegicus]